MIILFQNFPTLPPAKSSRTLNFIFLGPHTINLMVEIRKFSSRKYSSPKLSSNVVVGSGKFIAHLQRSWLAQKNLASGKVTSKEVCCQKVYRPGKFYYSSAEGWSPRKVCHPARLLSNNFFPEKLPPRKFIVFLRTKEVCYPRKLV